MNYRIKEVSYTRGEFHSLFEGRTVSTTIDKDKYMLKGETKKDYNSVCETFYLIVYTDNPFLYELSKLRDPVSDEFIDNLVKEIEETLSNIVREEKEKSQEETHKRALELINELK